MRIILCDVCGETISGSPIVISASRNENRLSLSEICDICFEQLLKLLKVEITKPKKILDKDIPF